MVIEGVIGGILKRVRNGATDEKGEDLIRRGMSFTLVKG